MVKSGDCAHAEVLLCLDPYLDWHVPGGRGSWVPKKEFPNGIKPLSDAAHAGGLKFLLWLDPEGVAHSSRIEMDHPEWLLHHPKEGFWGIYKWSNPIALQAIIDSMAGSIRDWGIDIYRNDRNTCPIMYWQKADTPDRQGITEIRQIETLYRFWDTLLQ
jgi:alpha-galactosidase